MDPLTLLILGLPQGTWASTYTRTSKVRKKPQAPSDGGWSSIFSISTPLFFFFFFSLPLFPVLLLFLGLQLHVVAPTFPFLFVPSCYTSTKEANMTRISSPCLFLFPYYNRSYATNNKIDQGHSSRLLFPTNWHQRLGNGSAGFKCHDHYYTYKQNRNKVRKTNKNTRKKDVRGALWQQQGLPCLLWCFFSFFNSKVLKPYLGFNSLWSFTWKTSTKHYFHQVSRLRFVNKQCLHYK